MGRLIVYLTIRCFAAAVVGCVLMFWVGRLQPGVGEIVFHSNHTDAHYGIYAVNIETGLQPRIFRTIFVPSTQESIAYSPACAPDGRHIAFIADFERREHIYLINPRGENLYRVTPLDSNDNGMPTWSPDGRRLLYRSGRVNGQGFYVYDLDTGDEWHLFDSAGRFFPAWSPDGRWIAFNTFHPSEIYVIDSGATLEPVLVTNALHTLSRVSWSPDSRRLVFEGRRAANEQFQLYRVNLDGTEMQPISPDGLTGALMADWSPDGQLIAFVGIDAADNRNIYLLPPDGEAYPLMSDIYDDGNPCWLP
jgi:Tol biopolymer transport system component